MLVSVLFCFLALAERVISAWPLPDDFAYWWWQTSVVAGKWLYIDAGEYYTINNTAGLISSNIPINGTIAVDLTQPWTVSTISGTLITKPPGMTLARRPYMWYDNATNTVYSKGGRGYEDGASYSLWSMEVDAPEKAIWDVALDNPIAAQQNPTFGSAFTASNENFYSLGGVQSGVTNTSLAGLLTYTSNTNTWNNLSSAGATPSGFSVQAEAVFMPNFGNAGLLAILGGDSPSNQTYVYEEGVALVQMDNITIYDPDTGIWYHQTATGQIPPPRSEYCAIGAAPADNGTFEIFVFGGSTNDTFDWTNVDDTGYTDVFVLSLPSFTWFQAVAPTQDRRSNHFCQNLGGGQMLVIGGRDPAWNGTANEGTQWASTDPWSNGMNIFDMTAWAWTGSYTPGHTYERPTVVQNHYNTHANNTNWSNPALSTLFVAKAATASPSTNPTSPSSSPFSSSSPSKSHSNTGAIVGGVVGGVCALALIAGLVFCLFRRRRGNRQSTPSSAAAPIHEMPPNDPKHELEQPTAELGHDQAVEMPAEYVDRDTLGQKKPLLDSSSDGTRSIPRKPIQYA